jgi:porin
MKKFSSINWFNLVVVSILFNQSVLFPQDESDQEGKIFAFQNELIVTGIDLGAVFLGDYFSNLSGGIQNEGSFVDNIILNAGLDMNKLASINGMSLYFSSIGINGGTFLENTGALQGISNIAGVNHWKVYEAWVEQAFFNDKVALLFGLYDLNSEFDVRESSGIFINPSYGIGFDFAQSGQNGPSIFPHTSLALRFKFSLTESFKIMAAVFDGVPGSLENAKNLNVNWSQDEGALLATELIFTPLEKEFGKNYSKYSIGGWYYTSGFEKIIDGEKQQGNFGIYFIGEQFIYTESSSSEQGLALFGRFGIANSNFNPSDYSILGGINYTGLIPGRDEDIFGLACTSIHLANEFQNSQESDSNFETILELTYSFQLLDWLRLQPDVQYVFNPVAAPHSAYAFTAGIRAEIAF